MEEKTIQKLRKLSDEALATYQQEAPRIQSRQLLCNQEWQRRAAHEQHKLDLILIKKQMRSTQFAAFLGVIGILGGAFLADYLGQKNHKDKESKQEQILSQKSGKNSAPLPLVPKIKAP